MAKKKSPPTKANFAEKVSQLVKKSPLPLPMLATLVIAIGLAFFGLKLFGDFDQSRRNANNLYKSYLTVGAIELRSAAETTASVKSVLKDGSLLSGRVFVGANNVNWAEVKTIDGETGYVEAADLVQANTVVNLNGVASINQKTVTTTNIHLRAYPSLSGQIIGVADGGTRLIADGQINSEGEEWLRIPLGRDVTAFILARFTSPDDDRQGNAEGFADQEVGVLANARTIVNVQATPFENARIIRSINQGEALRVLGQTNAGIWWYIVSLNDGAQGFAPKDSIAISQTSNHWVYADGTEAPGPNIPKGSAAPVTAKQIEAPKATADEPLIVDMNENIANEGQTSAPPSPPK
ncbi:MAG: hypothetical protein FD163_1098 [Hyphomonadaceae bacterium]|nr:MAG: hypothetical protein FD163_1098 [Hyphomonadaceae bacterium]